METTRAAWAGAFAEGLEKDAWGLAEEAVETWQRLRVAAAAEYSENLLQLAPRRREAVGDLASILACRILELKRGTQPSSTGGQSHLTDSNGRPVVGLAGMESLKPFIAGLLFSDVQVPPALLPAARSSRPLSLGATSGAPAAQSPSPRTPKSRGRGLLTATAAAAAAVGERQALTLGPSSSAVAVVAAGATNGYKERATTDEVAMQDVYGRGPGAQHGTLRPPPPRAAAGDASLSIFIDTWDVKGADRLVDASVAVSVRNAEGQLLEALQETPAASGCVAQELRWGATVHLQTPLSALGEGWAVFFELRHWKAAKHKRSTKAWALLEQDEISPLVDGMAHAGWAGARGVTPPATATNGNISDNASKHRKALELYAKPPLYPQALRNCPKLFTTRPQYLHISLHLTPGDV